MLAKSTESNAAWRKEAGLSSDMTVNWTKVTRESAQAQEFMSGKVGKTAADFKPATAAMREASVATKDVGLDAKRTGGFMEGFAGRLIGVTAAFKVLRYAAEAVKYVIGSSMDLESADVRFKSLAGNTQAATTAFAGMSQVADDTTTSVVELSKAGITLLEAGVPMEKINDELEVMAKDAHIAGENLQEVANIQLRLSRGEVGARDLAAISRLTGDETGRLQAQYKDISVTIPLIAKEMERVQRATERARADTDLIAERTRQDADLWAARDMQDRNLQASRTRQDSDLRLSAQTSFIEKHGDAKGIAEAFQRASGQGQAPYIAVPGMEGVSGGGQKQESILWKQLQEGVKQIGKEEELSSGEMAGLVQKGFFSNDELMAASGRRRAATETGEDRARSDKDTGQERERADTNTEAGRTKADKATDMQIENEGLRGNLELRKEREKQQLIDDARNQLAGTSDTPVWDAVQRDRNYHAYQQTTQGMADKAGYEVQKAASHVGTDINSAWDLDARSAGTVELPWSKSGGAASKAPPVKLPGDNPQASSGSANNQEIIAHLRELIAANKDINQTMVKVFG